MTYPRVPRDVGGQMASTERHPHGATLLDGQLGRYGVIHPVTIIPLERECVYGSPIPRTHAHIPNETEPELEIQLAAATAPGERRRVPPQRNPANLPAHKLAVNCRI